MSREKVLSRSEVRTQREALREQKVRIGFTSGVFDLMHAGHVQYLEDAKQRCDVLIVGVNSDASVRENKGPLRPLIPEAQRAAVVAGLACVDLVFVFDERNNNENVRALTPDIYFKAGDYSAAKLSSGPIVEGYGGTVEIVPFQHGLSTTAIIERVIERYSAPPIALDTVRYARQPAVFVDRDGTINEHVEYLHEPDKFRFIPGALEGLRKLREHGYRVVIVTNQPGIGLGYFTKEQFFVVNREFLRGAAAAGVGIDRVYFCPHNHADGCTCRKPEPGLILRAVEDLNIALDRSFMIGDMTSDIELAQRVGCRGILVKTGMGGKDGRFNAAPAHVVADLAAAADVILSQYPKPMAE